MTEAQVLEAKKSNKHFTELLELVQNNMKVSRLPESKVEYVIE